MTPHLLSPDVIAAVKRETAEASALPNHAYTSEEFFALERDEIFSQTWTCIGNACAVPANGDLRPASVLGIPLVMVRGRDGHVRVFHNVCRHRGNQLVIEQCNVKGSIMCPYHGWTYSVGGELLATPHVGGHQVHEVDSIDKQAYGLHEVRSEVWLDLVFVNLSGDAAPFDEFIAPLQSRIGDLAPAEEFERLRPASTHGAFSIEFAGNWKLCLENNLESYHLPWVHPDLNAVSRLEDHYHFYGGDLFAGQGTVDYDHTRVTSDHFPQFDEWRDRIAEYPTLFPNVFLGLHSDHFWTRIVEPISPSRSMDHLQIYYLGDAASSPELDLARKQRLETWTKVFFEDLGVVQGMQRGRHSPAFDGGVFSPVMDAPSHHFAKWVVDQLT